MTTLDEDIKKGIYIMEASPQVENGFTRIANELLEAMLRANFNGREWKLIMTIIRKTYGFGKKSDRISYSQIKKLTGIRKQHINFVFKSLIKKNIIKRKKLNRGRGYEIRIQKDYSKWECGESYREWLLMLLDISVTKSSYKEIPKMVTKESPVQVTTKETKENVTKESAHSKGMSVLVDQFINDWNIIITSTRISNLTRITAGSKRYNSLTARLKDKFFIKHYPEALKKVNTDSFCNGYEGDRSWTATVQWFTRAGVIDEIMEWNESRRKCSLDSDTGSDLIEPNRSHVNY